MLSRLARRVRGSRLARNAGWLLAAQVARGIAQAGYFVLVARALGAREFGALAAALALIAILVPFAGSGSGQVLVMHVARAPETFARFWGNALLTVAALAPVLGTVAVVIAASLLPVSWQAVALLAAADLAFGRVAEISSQSFQALERLRASALLSVLPSFARFGAAAAFVTWGSGATVGAWAGWYVAAIAAAAALSLAVVWRTLGRPRPGVRSALVHLRESTYFALGLSSSSVHADIDKTLVARLAGLEAAGIYAAAYRGVSTAFAPVLALLYATYARFFRHGEAGVRASLSFAQRLLPVTAGYGAAVGVVLFAAAPLVPLVLGSSYEEAADALRWLAPLPLLQALGYLAGDALTGAGYQALRSALQIGTVGANVALCLWLIPLAGWQGAAWATLVSYSLLAAVLWAASSLIATAPREAPA